MCVAGTKKDKHVVCAMTKIDAIQCFSTCAAAAVVVVLVTTVTAQHFSVGEFDCSHLFHFVIHTLRKHKQIYQLHTAHCALETALLPACLPACH